MRFVFRVLYDAIMRFSQDDGWAIASHIALSILTSLFPFLIFVTALAGFFGSKSLADEVAHILLQTWPPQVAAPIANEIHNVLTQTRSGLLTISVILAIYFSSSGIEAVRIGLHRAYDVRDSRPWWLMRLDHRLYFRWRIRASDPRFPCGSRALDLEARAALTAGESHHRLDFIRIRPRPTICCRRTD